MNPRLLLFAIMTFLLFALPAYAYGDPTGGSLFQTLGPLLAILWGFWMILANSIRRLLINIRRRLRGGTEPEQPVS
jgi:ABC-type Co2+ transport system permease subunit